LAGIFRTYDKRNRKIRSLLWLRKAEQNSPMQEFESGQSWRPHNRIFGS